MTDAIIAPNTVKMAPNSPEAEEALLGSLLIDPGSLDDLPAGLSPQDFFIVKNRWVFEAILTLRAKGSAIDNLTVGEELRSRNRLSEIGGMAYLTALMNNTPTHIHAETYAVIVHSASTRRQYLAGCQKIGEIMNNQNITVEDAVEQAEKILFTLRRDRLNERRDIRMIGEVASDVVDQIEKAEENPPEVISLGLPELDRLCLLEKGEVSVIAARTRMGKTALLLQICAHVAKDYPVLFDSLEMSAEQLTKRYLSAEGRINNQLLRLGNFDQQYWPALIDAQMSASKLKLMIDDTPDLNIMDIRARARQLYGSLKPKLIVVDFLGLLLKGRGGISPREEMGLIFTHLKNMARELDVPVLALSQLNRDTEAGADKRPHLNNLKETSVIEELAWSVSFMYRDEIYHPDTAEPNVTEFYSEKNRGAPEGKTKLYFVKEQTKFTGITTVNLNEL